MTKDKHIAAILSLFFGWLGFHRYYLGEKWYPAGVLLYAITCYCYDVFIMVIPFVILGVAECIGFVFMDWHTFNQKYNR